MRIILGTRGSELARAQTSLVEHALRSRWPDLDIAVEIITTRGDEKKSGASFQLASNTGSQVENLRHGRKGLFTGEIERALLQQRIDVAVHSAKDLPSDPTADLEICAALPRAAVEDVLVSKSSVDFASLPAGAVVGTGSVRRQHQVTWARPDVKVVDLRGNVPTRLRKLAANSWEAIILARAGLERLGYDCSHGELNFESHNFQVSGLPIEKFLPAGGQGIVALQCRTSDEQARTLLASINHAETFLCLRAEREFLRLLQGDCGTPVGVLATIESGTMNLRAQVFEEMRAEPKTATCVRNPVEQKPELVAARLFSFINGQKK